MKPTQGGGGGRAAAIALNRLITQEESPEGLLCLVEEELGNLNDVNVSTAFSKLGKLCSSRSFPRNVAANDRFRGLTVLARDMCADGRLQEQVVASITHAVGKMSAAGKLAADDADVQDTLAALEGRVVLVASHMVPQEVANAIWAFATLGLMPGLRHGRRWRLRWCGWVRTWIPKPRRTLRGVSRRSGGRRGLRRGRRWRRR